MDSYDSANYTELQKQAIDAIHFYTDLGNEILAEKMKYPNVNFSLRGRCGGIYSPKGHTVKVNMVLFSENVQAYIDRTIPHEVAHAFQRHIYGSFLSYPTGRKRVMPHGKEWKRIMSLFGKDSSRCHSYDTSNATAKTVPRNYVCRCDCQEHHITVILYRRIKEGTVYRCRKCKTRIVEIEDND